MFILEQVGSFLFLYSIIYILFGVLGFIVNFFFNDDFESVKITIYDKLIYIALISYILNYIIF